MKPVAPLLTFAMLAAIAAGCTGGPGNLGAVPVAAPNAAHAGQAFTPNHGGPCPHDRGGCGPQLVVPLSFDGTTFTVASFRSCDHIQQSDAPRYQAPSAGGTLTLSSNVVLPPTCVPAGVPVGQQLYIGAMQSGGHGGGGGGNVTSDKGKAQFVPIAGPVAWSDSPWSFAPVSPALVLQPNARYVFFILAAPLAPSPSPSPIPTQSPSGNYLLLQPMSYNGSTFAVVPSTCFHIEPGSAPVYVAPASGTLALSGPVSIPPTCVPSPLPSASPLPQLSIVAIAINGHDSSSHSHRPADHGGFGGIPAIAVAGPVNIPDNPWNFAPDSPGLTMQAGAQYAFFIAIPYPSAPPTPAPPQLYRAVAPLSFDGTNFTLAAITSCDQLTAPSPYPAPSTGPLTLSGAVSVAPTCVPSPPPTGVPPPMLYVVASIAHGGDDAIRNPHDGGGGGGGGGGGHGTYLLGFPIAGPAAVAANPWTFTPLAPPLTLQQGVQYEFFVGTPATTHGGH